MTDDDKKPFALMMRIVWHNYGKAEPARETMAYWFAKLYKYDFQKVHQSFDYWVDHNNRQFPSVKDILDLLKPKEEFYKALPRPVPNEISKQQSEKIVEMVKEIKPVKDYKKWARDILANPKGLPDISIRFAKEALNAE